MGGARPWRCTSLPLSFYGVWPSGCGQLLCVIGGAQLAVGPHAGSPYQGQQDGEDPGACAAEGLRGGGVFGLQAALQSYAQMQKLSLFNYIS